MKFACSVQSKTTALPPYSFNEKMKDCSAFPAFMLWQDAAGATVNCSPSVVHSARKSFYSFQEEKQNEAASNGCVCGRHGMRSYIDTCNWTTGIANSAPHHCR
jgi:hypothetical protein